MSYYLQPDPEKTGDLTMPVALGVLRIIFLKQKPNLLTNQPIIPSRCHPSNDFFASPRRTRVVWCACAVTRNGFVMRAEEGSKPRRILPSPPVRNRQMFERCFFVTLHRRRTRRFHKGSIDRQPALVPGRIVLRGGVVRQPQRRDTRAFLH